MLAILQARMNSSRLPGKVMKLINGRPSIEWQIERISKSKSVSQLVVATSHAPTDDPLVDFLVTRDVEVHRGALDDVLSRFCEVVQRKKVESFIRLTADCPLFMPTICDDMVDIFQSSDLDYVSNTIPPTFPNGCDVEVVRSSALFRVAALKPSTEFREHVTLGIYSRRNMFHCRNYFNPRKRDDSRFRWTLDTERDLEFVRSVYSQFIGQETIFGYDDVMVLLDSGSVKEHLEVDQC
jgi:spore coat polysaccharide biosynthesis protein SpsF